VIRVVSLSSLASASSSLSTGRTTAAVGTSAGDGATSAGIRRSATSPGTTITDTPAAARMAVSSTLGI
jgi:hypothetical protein